MNTTFRLQQTGEQVQNLLNQIPSLATELLTKYTKPDGGIPYTDLTAALQSAIEMALTAYQKPGSGIPKTDLTTAVQNLLDAAGSAYQKPGSGIPKTDLASAVQALLDAAGTAYQKPASGIPLNDLAASVQAAINASASMAQDIAAERLARETADLAINEALGTKLNQSQVQAIVTAALANYDTSAEVATAITNALASYYTKTAIDGIVAGLQSKLTFDQTPMPNSANPVTSAGIRAAIANAVNGLVNSTYVQNAITTALANYSTTSQISAMITTALTTTLANYYTKAEVDNHINGIVSTIQAQAAAATQAAEDADDKATEAAASAAAANQKLSDLETYLGTLDPESAASVAAALGLFKTEVENDYAKKTGYYQGMAVGLADNIRGDVTSTEQFRVRPTGGAGNEVGQIGVLKAVQGAGFSSAQLYPEGSDHTFSADADITDAVVIYSNKYYTVEMGYLMTMECFINKVFTQAALDAVSAKDAGKAAGDKCVWLTPGGGVTTAPTIAEGEESVTFSGWRIAIRVKASEVRDHTAAAYWFTDGSVGRQVKDVAVAVGINWDGRVFSLTDGWHTKSAMEWLVLEAQNGLPTVQRKAEQKLLGVTKFGFRTVKSRNLLNPATGKAFVTAYTNDEDGFEDNLCTVIGGMPSGTTLSFQSLLTNETEAISVDANNHFTVPCTGWVIVSGTLPASIILTWDGKYDSAPADTYETEAHSWVVSGLKGKLNGEGESVQIKADGTLYGYGKGALRDVINLVHNNATIKMKKTSDFSTWSWNYDSTYDIWRGVSASDSQDYKRSLGNNSRVLNITTHEPSAPSIKMMFSGNCYGIQCASNPNQEDAFCRNGSSTVRPSGVGIYELATYKHYTDLTYLDPVTGTETALAELQFADNNWSIEETIFDEPTTDANDVQSPVAVTPVLTSEYSMDAAELLDTLSVEYAALEERVAALEAIINT